jgi:hypothetical protein
MFRQATVRRVHAKLSLSIVLLLVASVINFGTAPFVNTTQAAGKKSVRQVMFWNKQKDTSVETAAARASFVALPRVERAYRETMRSHGYGGKFVQYYLATEVHGPGPYANSSAACDSSHAPHINQVAHQTGDFCRFIHPNESWFLHNAAGQRLYYILSGRVIYHMNPASSGWRSFALQRMVRDVFGDSVQAKLGFDGVILDNVGLGTYKLRRQLDNSDGVVKEFASAAAYRDAMRGYLALLSGTLRPNSLIWANIIDDYGVSADEYMSYVQYLDGWMNEAWAVGWNEKPLGDAEYNTNLDVAERTLQQGKGVITNVVGSRYDYNRQQFGLASYLLITNNSTAFFRYSDPAKYGEWWQYDNYNLSLGAPLGKRYASGDGWRRDFACGYVTTTPATRASQIVQSPCKEAPSRIALPGQFQAENYKSGGPNVGYYDSSSGNQGGQYRSDDVDIQQCTDGDNCYNIGWMTANEWLAYDVSVATTGNYQFKLRTATPYTGRKLRIEVDGVNVSGSISVPATSDWQSWTDVTDTIALTAGNHTIKIVAETSSININYITVTKQ